MNTYDQKGMSAQIVILAFFVVSTIGLTGWRIWQTNRSNSPSQANTTLNTRQEDADDPYAGWNTYTSSQEKLSFKYPADWKLVKDDSGRGDNAELTSQDGKFIVSWFSAIDGIGGACDGDIMPGSAPSESGLEPCPYWQVLDRQKLSGLDLYYVAGVVTGDGQLYYPWCALQSSDGILDSQSNIGYQLFKATQDYVWSGGNAGKLLVGLKCGKGYGDSGTTSSGLSSGNKSEVTALLKSKDMEQAKLILLSASH